MTLLKSLMITMRALVGVLGFLGSLFFSLLAVVAIVSGDGAGILFGMLIMVLIYVVWGMKSVTDNFKFGERVGEQWLPDWPRLFVNGNCITVYAPGGMDFKPWNVNWWTGDPFVMLELSPSEIIMRHGLNKKRLALDPGVPVSVNMRSNGKRSELIIKFGVREHQVVSLRDHQRAQQLFDALKRVFGAFTYYVETEVRVSGSVVIRKGEPDRGLMELVRSRPAKEEAEKFSGNDKGSEMSLQGAYEILGTSPNSSFNEITEIWRGLRQIYSTNEAGLKEIDLAYQIVREKHQSGRQLKVS